MTKDRRQQAYSTRLEAAEAARDREHPTHLANGDEQRFASANFAMSFSKGLHHDPATGLLLNPNAFRTFRAAIDAGYIDPFTTRVIFSTQKERKWEAPTAGVAYELQGPDPQAVTMPPAPALGSDELAYEMAEVYELALLRDVPLTELQAGTTHPAVLDAVQRLNALPYEITGAGGRPRKHVAGAVTPQTVFRGSSPGVELGPYLSQFMLIGNDQCGHSLPEGYVQYGALRVDQRVPFAVRSNYMIEWDNYIAVQNGQSMRDNSTLFDCAQPRNFITIPRDLATYVHDDALYEAYLNACLILLSMQGTYADIGAAPFDPGFDALSGGGELFLNSFAGPQLSLETHARQAGGFALFGGPHILTLVTEVATRALKAVRFQKFNNHLRLRPEALAARIDHASQIEAAHPEAAPAFTDLASAIAPTVTAIRSLSHPLGAGQALLPMAFQEGSPMHPSYGAGHATVAGACVTILKAFFDTSAVWVRPGGTQPAVFKRYESGDVPVHYVPGDEAPTRLNEVTAGPFLTLEGELNKLAANISIGRNMAGVHYFSDYYDSLRMGEAIAIGILEEQALCYRRDPFVLTVPTFDGGVRTIGRS